MPNRRLFSSLFAAAIGVLALHVTSKADPITDLRSLSVFKDADLGKMAGGDVLASKGPADEFCAGVVG